MIRVGLGLLGLVTLAAAPRPTGAALRKAFEANSGSVVEVVGPKKTGAGVVVAPGHVVTSVDFVSLKDAKVRVGEQTLSGKVVMANAELMAAVVQVDDAAPLRAPAVSLHETFVKGTELVAIERDDKGALQPHLAVVTLGRRVTSPFVEVDVPLQNGTPLFDARGRLVAISVQRRKGGGSRALPIPEVKTQLQTAASAP